MKLSLPVDWEAAAKYNSRNGMCIPSAVCNLRDLCDNVHLNPGEAEQPCMYL